MINRALRLAAQSIESEAAMEEMIRVAKELREQDPNSELARLLEERVATEMRLRALVARIKSKMA
ncbi:hypothetical protein [Microvirga pudoricolor]|uniref:hypothetical protein n=1 Tax=Microvirga pudoricolor TaxID=2778729 RepID=UPI00195214A4|nr:hypothetical protein [Microvirga pudoricolor]MBM6595250.1 hypothetical protein [Microvirga pudoricolor]